MTNHLIAVIGITGMPVTLVPAHDVDAIESAKARVRASEAETRHFATWDSINDCPAIRLTDEDLAWIARP